MTNKNMTAIRDEMLEARAAWLAVMPMTYAPKRSLRKDQREAKARYIATQKALDAALDAQLGIPA